MTHVGFAILWIWQKAWSEDGLLPLVEHNQGTISVIALALALGAFIAETRRANREAAEAKATAEAAKLEEQRRSRVQRIEARHAANAEKRRQVNEFVRAVQDVIATFVGKQGPDGFNPTGGWWWEKEPTTGALETLASTAPRDPALLMLVHRAVRTVRVACEAEARVLAGGFPAKDVVDANVAELSAIEGELMARQKELLRLYA